MCVKINRFIWICLGLIITVVTSCNKDDDELLIENVEFLLSSSVISSDSLLPTKYTCSGESSTLPVNWENPPEDVVAYTLIMHHEAPEGIHCYWIVYNIPENVSSLLENETGIGSFGANTVNGKNEYAPPCSQGPGEKAYTYTLYALSEELEITVPSAKVDFEFVLEEMEDIIISTASMIVLYSRQFD